MVWLHKFPNYQQNEHVFLAGGQTVMVCGPQWTQRYIRAVFEHQCLLASHAFSNLHFETFPTSSITLFPIQCTL